MKGLIVSCLMFLGIMYFFSVADSFKYLLKLLSIFCIDQNSEVRKLGIVKLLLTTLCRFENNVLFTESSEGNAAKI